MKGTIAETYLRGRGITANLDLPALGFLATCYYRDEGDEKARSLPGLDGHISSINRTWLRPDGSGKAELPTPRKALGELNGHGVRFGIPGEVLAVGEGIETMLALRFVLPDMPMVAALSANHLGTLLLPEGLQRLYIACDNDRTGLDAGLAANRAHEQGIRSRLLVPATKDFNDDLQAFGFETLLEWLQPHLWRGDQLTQLSANSGWREPCWIVMMTISSASSFTL